MHAAAGVGGGGGGGGGSRLDDKLKIFKTDKFDPDSYVQSKCKTMNEKVRGSPTPSESEIGLGVGAAGKLSFVFVGCG
jgi:hypothetical protein